MISTSSHASQGFAAHAVAVAQQLLVQRGHGESENVRTLLGGQRIQAKLPWRTDSNSTSRRREFLNSCCNEA
jgi:hypothetical protein